MSGRRFVRHLVHDPHCDHVAAAKIVRQARQRLAGVRVFSYPVWGWTLPAEAEVGAAPTGFRFGIPDQLERKALAIAAHRSQTTDLIDDDPNGFRLTEQMLAPFRSSYEILLLTEDMA